MKPQSDSRTLRTGRSPPGIRPTKPRLALRNLRVARRNVVRRTIRSGKTFPAAPIMEWSTLETRLIRISEARIELQRKCGMLGEQHSRAFLIRHGSATAEQAGAQVPIGSGHWIIATPGCESFTFSPDTKTLCLTFDAAWQTGESLFVELECRAFSAAHYRPMEKRAVALLAYVNRHIREASPDLLASVADLHVYFGLRHCLDMWMEAFVVAMLSEGAQPTRLGVSDSRIERATRLLDSWPLDTPLDRHRVAMEAGLTVQHLDRLLSAEKKITACRYFNRRRIAFACRRLCDADATIKAIASDLGFHSEAHFSHWFKQHAHECPRSFRHAHIAKGSSAT